MKKNNNILLLILNIILLSINLLFNLSLNTYLFGIGVLFLLFLGTLFKKYPLIFIVISIPVFYFIVNSVLDNLKITYIIFAISFLIYYIYSFRYTFNLINNNMNIKFNNIQIPENKEYLIIRYLLGPINGSNMNGIIIKEKDYFSLSIENNENNVEKLDILFTDIESIKVDKKPYMKSTTSLTNYETDFMKSSAIGKYTGDFERVKDFKMIPSYEINILLKNNTNIKILAFNEPSIFEN